MDTLTTLPMDSFVASAFAELLEDVTGLLSAAQTQKPCDKEEVAFWRRQLNALNKAECYFAQGVRPVISGQAYLLASASRPGALVHRLSKHGGIVVCSCEAGQKQQLCWHHVLVNVAERAAELESLDAKDVSSSGPDTTPEAAAALLETRLIETARIIEAMRRAQGRGPLSFPDFVGAGDPPIDIPHEPQPPTPGGPQPPIWPEPGGRQIGYRLAVARRHFLEAA